MFRPARSPGALIESPLVLGALALWALNDHVLKAHFGGLITGKLSDICCLIVIPVIIGAGAELVLRKERYKRGHRVLVVAAVAASLIMIAINTIPAAGDAYEWGLGALQWPFRSMANLVQGESIHGVQRVQLWMDGTDAFTAPAAALPVLLNARRLRA